MKRDKKISVRLSEEEFKLIKTNAEAQEMEVCEYVREASCYRDVNWISKQVVVKYLGRIKKILDRYEVKEKKVTKLTAEEVEKLWSKL